MRREQIRGAPVRQSAKHPSLVMVTQECSLQGALRSLEDFRGTNANGTANRGAESTSCGMGTVARHRYGRLGGPALAWWANSALGVMVTIAELAVAVTVVTTALFGSEIISERAFRLLRWLANRPEPQSPKTFAGPGPIVDPSTASPPSAAMTPT